MSTAFGVPEGPPWDVDVVADVHAGVYPADQTADLRRRIAADPQGAAILAALDSTVDDLSLLPALTMPEKYVLRLDAAIAREYQTGSKVTAGSAPATATGAPAISGQRAAGGIRPAGPPAVLHGIGALLRPGIAPAGTTPAGVQRGSGPVLPRQSGPRHPGAPAPHLARRQPVIPQVLPGGLRTGPPVAPGQSSMSAPSPAAPRPQQSPSNVSDLRSARNRGAAGPSPVGRPVERSSTPRVGSLQAQRTRRRRWTGGLLAAAAVIAVGAITTVALTSHDRGNDRGVAITQPGNLTTVTLPSTFGETGGNSGPGAVNSPGQTGEAVIVEKGKLGAALSQIEGKQAAGRLANPGTYAACLGANNIGLGTVSGTTSVTFEGKDAFAIAVKQTDPSKAKVVIVGTDCGTNGAADTLDSEITTR